jgi:hypothetical protein
MKPAKGRPAGPPFSRPGMAGDLQPARPFLFFNIISQSIGGTSVSPVKAQAKACGYQKLSFDCNLL